MKTVKILTPEERKYTFRQSQQIYMQTGFIGYMQADFGPAGNEFRTIWHDFWKELKTDEFRTEYDNIINELRKDDILSDLDNMSSYCNSHPESSFDDGYNYGIRLDTEKYSYLIRFNPNRGEYNLYCYCYKRESLENHMQCAKKGIRFIDSTYNEKFRLVDGEAISIKSEKDGKVVTIETCRYVDDYHLEVGSNLYHICQFAELCERNGYVVEPYKEES